jgi:hypothetical protein
MPSVRAITLGADRGYDAADFVEALRTRNVRPHVAQKRCRSAIDGRTTRHAGYAASQRIRKRIEETFGPGPTRWTRSVGSGSAELLEDGKLEIEFEFDHAGAALLRAERATSSTAR